MYKELHFDLAFKHKNTSAFRKTSKKVVNDNVNFDTMMLTQKILQILKTQDSEQIVSKVVSKIATSDQNFIAYSK